MGVGLVLDAVHEIFGRKLVGRIRLVTEQVADGVIVLAVRQPANHNLRGLGRRFGFGSLQRHPRQLTHPVEE